MRDTNGNPVLAKAIIALAFVIGDGSLVAFAWFLAFGPPLRLEVGSPAVHPLAVDGALCLAFFLQHSSMLRGGLRRRLGAWIPEHYYQAAYAIASGATLLALIVLWQPSGAIVYRLGGPFRLLPFIVGPLVVAAFVWSVRALRGFDLLGVGPIRRHLRGKITHPPAFRIAGPYRCVRHPMYLLVLVLIWSSASVTADRLLFNLLFSVWIVVGTVLEERDLVAAFGEDYRAYQETVPMLLPWRRPRHPAQVTARAPQ